MLGQSEFKLILEFSSFCSSSSIRHSNRAAHVVSRTTHAISSQDIYIYIYVDDVKVEQNKPYYSFTHFLFRELNIICIKLFYAFH
jgi:Golgi nucleoside diphosphatase